MKIKVNATDLIGDLEGFPFEVVEKMLEYQYAQTKKIEISVFQKDRTKCDNRGGFRWGETNEGHEFWTDVIRRKNFDRFFKRYPKSREVYIRGRGDIRSGESVIKELESRGGINTLDKMGNANNMLYFIDPITNCIESAVDTPFKNLLKTCYTEITPIDTMVELTMEEIAEKIGVDVNKLRIKK